MAEVLKGMGKGHTRMAYKKTRRVRCTQCGVTGRVQVSSERGKRLRDRLSPCCKARMRPANWVKR